MQAIVGLQQQNGIAKMELGELAAGLGDVSAQDLKLPITGICADSRKVVPGSLFAALPGTNVNGANYIDQAIKAGAAAIVVAGRNGHFSSDVPVIGVDDPHLVLARMASRFYRQQPETMMAVTGTAGKTSVAEFLRQIWACCGREAAFIGTTGVVAPGMHDYGNLTTPDPVTLHKLLDQLARAGVSHGAMEASSHGLDQKRLHGVSLSGAGFTNLGRDHLDYHDNIESYFAAKMVLFSDLLPKGSPAVIFVDDPYGERVVEIADKARLEVLSVGREGRFLTLKRVEHERHSQVAEIVHGNQIYRVQFPLAGGFQLSNALVAAGLALAGGEKIESVMEALEILKGASGRLELVGYSSAGAPVYVDYAHKPEALENVLKSLRPFATRKLVLVFGCGGDRDAGKRPVMGEISEALADKVIVTDDNPRTEDAAGIRRAILNSAPSAIEIADRREAIVRAVEELREGDCLVVAGKGHESGQIVGEEVFEFSDHVEIRRALGMLSS